jgi:hypothetical protein
VHKCIAAIMALLITTFIADRANAGTVNLKVSSSQLEKECGDSGGKYNTGDAGSYGCTGPGGQINCDQFGNCKGTCPKCGTKQAKGGIGGVAGIVRPTAGGIAQPKSDGPQGSKGRGSSGGIVHPTAGGVAQQKNDGPQGKREGPIQHAPVLQSDTKRH